jgi:isoleucyl-tRNA synthetase
MSNWYIRRSRRRFWKSEDDGDKAMAYETLWYSLMRICQLLAPWAPFVSDHVWRELAAGTDMPSSVHLSDWPEVKSENSPTVAQMTLVRDVIKEALALRAESSIKVRQPLESLTVHTTLELDDQYADIIRDEVNVKHVAVKVGKHKAAPELDTNVTPELKREGIMRDVIRLVQSARKQAGLQVDDRIELGLKCDDHVVTQAIAEHAGAIKAETLAVSLDEVVEGYTTEGKVEGAELTISLCKHNSL